MSQVRLFVGNLPFDTQDYEVSQEFSCYGEIKSVEIKQKKSPCGDEVLGVFAFVTIQIDDYSLEKCLREFSNEQFKGVYLSVSVARESFLDRLRREREEAGLKDIEPTPKNTNDKSPIKVAPLPFIKAQISNDESDESDDDEEEVVTQNKSKATKMQLEDSDDDDKEGDVDDDGDVIIKKSSKNSLRNGVIQIPSVSSKILHVIKTGNDNKIPEKQLDKRSKESDQKRKESLEKMKNAHLKQKMAIKAALSSVDRLNSFNKIRFEDAEEPTEDEIPTKLSSQKKASVNLFDEDNDEDDNDYANDFKIKEQFQGEKGEQLMKLQSRFKNDERFQMGKNFQDTGDEDATATDLTKPETPTEDADSERRWQFEILEQVTGKQFLDGPDPERTKSKNAVQMLRYDPTKEDHNKFLVNKKRPLGDDVDASEKSDKPTKKQRKNVALEVEIENTGVAVSKEQFFNVSNKLSDSLRNTNEGFSLLSMFGRADDTETDTAKNASYSERALALQNNKKTPFEFNPFKYDSSDSEDDSVAPASNKVAANETTVKVTNEKAGAEKAKKKVWRETFFLVVDDVRFKDGALFYEAVEAKEEVEEEAIKAKDELRKIIKRKIKKTVSNTMSNGITPGQFKKIRKFRRGH